MNKKEYDSFAKNCILGSKPPCSAGCPLNLDIPAILHHLQSGNFSAAYRLYRNQSVFPGIVSEICTQPCRAGCVRREKDEAISLLLLEKACVQFASSDTPPSYNLPKRNKRVSVIGGGLAGLTCALKLGAKSYDVTLYEKKGVLGGRLHELLNPEIFLPEIAKQMQFARCQIELNREVLSLSELEFDAAFIATGPGGNHFGLIDRIDRNAFSTAQEGVFIGGGIIEAESVEDIAQGIVASHSIEKYLKISKMDGIPETFIDTKSCIVKDMSRVEKISAVRPADGEKYQAEEAVSESARCLLCDCTECKDVCEIFDFFRKSPRQIAGEALTSLHTKAGITKQMATRMIASCNLCGLCGKVCPEQIDMGQLAYDFRYFTAQSKIYPPAFSDFFIRDMLFSNREASLFRPAPDQKRISFLFFPGCQLGASKPEYVLEAYRYLLKKLPGTAILLGCCGAPADWGADRELNQKTIGDIKRKWESCGNPVMIFACPTCQRQISKFVPEISQRSLYEVIADNGLADNGLAGEGIRIENPMSIFDPCASREYPSLQEAVRKLAVASGAELEELFFSRDRARCCGWGGHTETANKALTDRIIHNRISSNKNPYITYCTNCRDTFVGKGKECIHILDLFLGTDKDQYTPPSLGKRRKNKLTTKNLLLEKVFGEPAEEMKEDEFSMNVIILPEVLEKLRSQLILEDEVIRTIESCESTGNCFFDQDQNLFIGSLQIGIITYWVEYEKDNGQFLLKNAYSHRMQILGD